MKKKLISIGIVLMLFITLTGCSQTEIEEQRLEELKAEVQEQTEIKANLEEEIIKLENLVVENKIDKGVEEYILTIEIGQKHMVFDFDNMIKDEMNKIEIEIPVSKEFYNDVKIGTILDNSFREGSFLMSGSIGTWNIKVVGKDIR